MKHLSYLLAILCTVTLVSCEKSVAPPSAPITPTGSFALIQQKVFDVSCTQCHNDETKNLYGNLSLSDGSAYNNLVGASPANADALAHGLFRVDASHPESSFLLDKLNGTLDSLMGVRMPQTGQPLSSNKIEFIRQWIMNGAPKDGSVADASLLDDSGTSQAALLPLAPPPADSGFQLHLAPFSIPAASEREIFSYKTNPRTDTQWVNSLTFRMRQGSHHFILWTLDGAAEGVSDGEVRDRNDQEMDRLTRRFVFGAQTLDAHYSFPDGVALPVPPSVGFDLNSHYVNTTSSTEFGEAYINLGTVPKSSVRHVAQSVLDGDFDPSFVIKAHSTAVRYMNWGGFDVPTHLFLLSSHAHARMVSFKIFVQRANGTTSQIYESDDWHEPPIASLDLLLNPGDVILSQTTYKNDTNNDIKFGYTSNDEMNVIVGYYWQ